MDGGMGTSVELKAQSMMKVCAGGGRMGRWRRRYTTGVTGTLPGFGFGQESLAKEEGEDASSDPDQYDQYSEVEVLALKEATIDGSRLELVNEAILELERMLDLLIEKVSKSPP